MREETFAAAVEIARKVIAHETELWGETAAAGFAHLYHRRTEDSHEAYVHDLVFCSKEIRAAWVALRLIAAQVLREGKPLPPELASWTADVLEKRLDRPPGKDKDASLAKKRAFMVAIRHLNNQGMKATRNKTQNRKVLPEACFEGGSACDAVGVATKKNYGSVEGIWTESASPGSPIYRLAYQYVPRLSYPKCENK